MSATRSQFKKLDTEHAAAAIASLDWAMSHLIDATKSLEFGVPCEDCEKLRMILTYLDCASNLVQEAMKGLKQYRPPVSDLDKSKGGKRR